MERRAIRAIVVTDIGYGDAGKGTTVDYLVRQAQSAVVVRHNGGPQAAHNVVTPDGRHHTFAQFCSGSFVPGVRTHLSKHMLVNPLNMFPEAAHLESMGVHDIWDRVSVDREAIVILPWHGAANRLREIARGNARHGSCGQGVGEAMADFVARPASAVRMHELLDPAKLRYRLFGLRASKHRQLLQELDGCLTGTNALEWEWSVFTDDAIIDRLLEAFQEWTRRVDVVDGGYLQDLADRHELLVFEGAQGVLLDEWYGFHPYTTWSTTTHANADSLLADLDLQGPVTRLGVMRGYATRHGAGPFVTEDAALTRLLPDYHNGTDAWQGSFRVGYLDLVAHRYALAVCGHTDSLAVTGLDRLPAMPKQQVCDRYRLPGAPADAGRYFRFDAEGLVSDIRPGVQGDLDYQARLAELLLMCEPVYSPADQLELLETIEDRLGLPVSVTSYGPTAADKQALVAV